MSRLLVVVACLLLGGCVEIPYLADLMPKPGEPRLLDFSYKAGDQLHSQLEGSGVAGYPMLASSFVDTANVEKTNDLGMLLSEQIASRLSQLGYSVSEIQLRSEQLRVTQEGGVFALSRNIAEINADSAAYSILVGTYTIIGRQIYVNARVLRAGDGVALASSDFSLPYSAPRKAEGGGTLIQPSVKTSLN